MHARKILPRSFCEHCGVEWLTCECVFAALAEQGRGLEAALFVHMYLADMAAFGAANKAYNPHMPPVNPPARACVQTRLSALQPAALDVLIPCALQGQHCKQCIITCQPSYCVLQYSQ